MHNPRRVPPRRPHKQNISFILDEFSSADIRKWETIKDVFLKYHWDFYSSLAYQRSRISDKIRKSLLEATDKNYTFSRWQRTIRLKHSLEPLSIEGSILDQVGGRFNIGNINPSEFQPFPALYIASDRDTSLQEIICNKIEGPKMSLDPLDFALADRTSISHISIAAD